MTQLIAGVGDSLQSVSDKQDAMSQVAGQVLDQSRGLAIRIADISGNLLVLKHAGVSPLLPSFVEILLRSQSQIAVSGYLQFEDHQPRTHGGIQFLCSHERWNNLQDLLVERSSDTLRALAELDATETKRHRHNTALWQASQLSVHLRKCQAYVLYTLG